MLILEPVKTVTLGWESDHSIEGPHREAGEGRRGPSREVMLHCPWGSFLLSKTGSKRALMTSLPHRTRAKGRNPRQRRLWTEFRGSQEGCVRRSCDFSSACTTALIPYYYHKVPNLFSPYHCLGKFAPPVLFWILLSKQKKPRKHWNLNIPPPDTTSSSIQIFACT